MSKAIVVDKDQLFELLDYINGVDVVCPLDINEKYKNELSLCNYVTCQNNYGHLCWLEYLKTKELPQKKEVPFENKLMFITELSKQEVGKIGYSNGWNDCIDEITGRKKNDRN